MVHFSPPEGRRACVNKFLSSQDCLVLVPKGSALFSHQQVVCEIRLLVGLVVGSRAQFAVAEKRELNQLALTALVL